MKNRKTFLSPIYYIAVAFMAILFFTFHTIPFLKGVFYSFTDWKGYGQWKFVGIRNYIQLIKDSDTIHAYLFTFKFAIICTILINVISIILACALNANIYCKNFLKAIYFIPYMLGNVIIGFIFNYIFANIIPQIGSLLHIELLEANILGNDYAIWGVIIVTVWSMCAFTTLIYIAGLQYIDPQVYEAASIDGAKGLKRFFYITFPLFLPSFAINMVLAAKSLLMVYDQIMVMTDGGPGTSTTSVAVLIYKKGFGGGQFSYQSANAVVLFIIVVVISFFQLKVFEKMDGGKNE